jgi:hypothetical protein
MFKTIAASSLRLIVVDFVAKPSNAKIGQACEQPKKVRGPAHASTESIENGWSKK